MVKKCDARIFFVLSQKYKIYLGADLKVYVHM